MVDVSSNSVAPRAAPASPRKLTLRSYTTNDFRKTTLSGDASDNRFRRTNRLEDASAYGRVFRNAKRSRDSYFTVLYRVSQDLQPRLGLAIARKNCRSASGRNRIKRVVRESFRHNKGRLGGLDVVVLNTRRTHIADNRVLRDSLERHWQRCARASVENPED